MSENNNFALVSSKYNKVENRTEETKIKKLRDFNNWIKMSLINIFCPINANVFDICGGKGGDIRKYRFKKVNNYVLFDNANLSIKEAKVRVGKLENNIKAKNYIIETVNCFTEDITQKIPKDLQFDFVSCQFAIHYAFDNIKHIKRLFKNITTRLKEGGIFVGTTVDDKKLFEHLKKSDNLEFGNELYNVRFEQKNNFKTIGTKYYFTLTEAIPDIPEYLVRFKLFEKVANKYGLKLLYKKSFKECKETLFNFAYEYDLNKRVKDTIFNSIKTGYNRIGNIPENQWEICDLYYIFVFEKIKN